jgi:ATP/maltotriose-dependent transcriptional regulator MalT
MQVFYGRYVESESESRAALKIARSLDDNELLWRSREILVQVLLRQGKLEEGKVELDSIRAGVEAGDSRGREVLAIALVRLAVATQDPKIYQEARAYAERIDEEFGDTKGALLCASELAYDLHVHWNSAQARATYERVIEMTEKHGLWQSHLVCCNNLGCVEREIGHLDRARALWTKVRPMAKRLDVITSISCCAINFAELHLVVGDVERALKEAREGVRIARSSGIRSDIAEGLGILGAAECAMGNVKAGLAHMREGLDLRRTLNMPRFFAHELCPYVEQLLAAGELESAAQAARELRELFEKNPDRQIAPGRICLALAGVAQASGEEWEARRFRERGRRMVEHVLSRFTDPADRAAFAALEHNRTLLAR